MTSSSLRTRSWRDPNDVSGERSIALGKKDSPSYTVQRLGENVALQQEVLFEARRELNKESGKNPFATPLVIATKAGGDLNLLGLSAFVERARDNESTFTVLTRFKDHQKLEQAYERKAEARLMDLERELAYIKADLKLLREFYKMRRAAADVDDADTSGYVPLKVPGTGYDSPSAQAGGTRSIRDTLESTRATGSPAADDAAASGAPATETSIATEIKIKNLEAKEKEILSQISAVQAELDIDLFKLKSSPRFMMLERDYASDAEVIQQMYDASMVVVYNVLSSKLGVSEFSKLAAAADAVHDMPCDQAPKMWRWIVRTAERLDQAYSNARFGDRNPIDYEPEPDTDLLHALAVLASREQLFEQMGNMINPSAKLTLRMRLVPENDQTRLLLQIYGQLPSKEVDENTLRDFERELSNIPNLKAKRFRTQLHGAQSTQPQSAQRGSSQAKQPAAARLAQQTRSPPPHARLQQAERAHAPPTHSLTAPSDGRGAPQGDLCRRHNGQHLYRHCPDRRRVSQGGKVVNFTGQSQVDGNKARSSKAIATLAAPPRSLGAFAVLSGLDGDDDNQSEEARVRSVSNVIAGYGTTNACADSGASMHIVNAEAITEDRETFVKGSVTWGDGSTSKTLVKGTVSATLTGKDGTKQMISFPAWGVRGLPTQLLSATAFAHGGAALHVEKGNTYLDFRKLGGKRLLIGDDCMMRFDLTGNKQTSLAKANAASTLSASRKINRRRPRRRLASPPPPPLAAATAALPAQGN